MGQCSLWPPNRTITSTQSGTASPLLEGNHWKIVLHPGLLESPLPLSLFTRRLLINHTPKTQYTVRAVLIALTFPRTISVEAGRKKKYYTAVQPLYRAHGDNDVHSSWNPVVVEAPAASPHSLRSSEEETVFTLDVLDNYGLIMSSRWRVTQTLQVRMARQQFGSL